MSAKKTTSPEAEQNKLRKIEFKHLTALRSKVVKDFKNEFLRSQRECDAAAKAARTLHAKHLKLADKLFKSEARELANIDRRLGILNGRIHS